MVNDLKMSNNQRDALVGIHELVLSSYELLYLNVL